MYCINCGENLNSSDKYCPHCGHSLNNTVYNKDNDLKIVSIIIGILALLSMLTIILMPIAIIGGIIGLIIAICSLKKGPNIIGIILNSLAIFFSVLFIGLTIYFFTSIVNEDIIPSFEEYHEKI